MLAAPMPAAAPVVASDPRIRTAMPRSAVALTVLLAAATTMFSALALALPDWIDAIPSTLGSARGTALVLLVVAVPLLLLGGWLAHARGSRRGLVAHLGATGYIVYNGVVVALGLPFGRTFLPAVAMLGLGIWTLVALLSQADVRDFAAGAGARMPVRAIGAYLVVTAVLFALVWLRDIVPAVLAGDLSASVAESGLATNPVQVVDLAVSLPATALAGVWLWQRRPWGYLLAGMMLVLFAIESLGVAVDQWFAHLADPAFGLAGSYAFLAVTVVQCVPLAFYLVRLHDVPVTGQAAGGE